VRVGNGAFDQRQNDVYGAALDSILLHTRRSERLPRRLWPIVKAQAAGAMRVWREPDQGIWEARGAPQHYVSSKLMCWVAMDRAAKLAEIRGDNELARVSTTTPRHSTPRRCWRRSSACCPALTSGCGRACSRSQTS
jgi:GH15 family glucan-1,4-alpha-glucosidase